MNENQVRLKQLLNVYGITIDQLIEENADPLWLHQNEM